MTETSISRPPPAPPPASPRQQHSSEAIPSPGVVDLDTQAAFDRALEQLRGRDATSAIVTMRDAARRVAQIAGERSTAHAAALYRLGAVYLAAGDLPAAALNLKFAADVEPTDQQTAKDQLTYLMNVGNVYERMGELEKAEAVHRDALRRRESFYGVEHAGYAYGLASLASVLLRLGRADEALPMVTRARDICFHSPSPLLPEAFGLRAYVAKACGADDDEAFAGVAELPPEIRQPVYQDIINRSADIPLPCTIATLEALERRLDAAGAAGATADTADQKLRWNAGATLVNAARAQDNYPAWTAAIDRLVAIARAAGNRAGLVELFQSKAIALNLSKDHVGELGAYRAALAEANALGDPATISVVHRNIGICFREQSRHDEAERHLSSAVEFARQSGDAEKIGAALAAHGIFIQHNGNLERARPMLDEAVKLMPPTHPHYLYAANHLSAIVNNRSCGCGEMDTTIGETIERMVRDRLPADLLESVTVGVKPDAGPDVKVRLKRKPTEAELEQLQTVVNQAMIDLRRAMAQSCVRKASV